MDFLLKELDSENLLYDNQFSLRQEKSQELSRRIKETQ